MLLNFFRYIFLVAVIGGFNGWKVRWNCGAPTASRRERAFLRFDCKRGQWETDYVDTFVDSHRSLGEALQYHTMGLTRIDWVMSPFRRAHRGLLSVRGDASLKVLLWLLRDSHPWMKHVWESNAADGAIVSTETTYRNAAGWCVKHYTGGGISAENSKTLASLRYISAGSVGYWHVISGFQPGWRNDPDESRKYPLGMSTRSMVLAFRGL